MIIKNLSKLTIVESTALLIGFVAVLSLFVAYRSVHVPKSYVRGAMGHICYVSSQKPRTVTNPVYYDSLDGCNQSLTSPL